ncbi:MAG: hypothetical protein KBG16_02735 [Methanospirillum sp.]|nr:hypothetical protein [Methanospirillum sp.]MBP9007576.1 hypothetical protein [Methanospirillum sp.]
MKSSTIFPTLILATLLLILPVSVVSQGMETNSREIRIVSFRNQRT